MNKFSPKLGSRDDVMELWLNISKCIEALENYEFMPSDYLPILNAILVRKKEYETTVITVSSGYNRTVRAGAYWSDLKIYYKKLLQFSDAVYKDEPIPQFLKNAW